jgi:hypothetical protein
MLIGNHEFTAMNRNSQMFVHEYICQRLHVPNMRFSGFTDVYFVHEKGFKGGCKMSFSDVPPKKIHGTFEGVYSSWHGCGEYGRR